MMDFGDRILLRCRITRGGFSGERVFRVAQADSAEEYIGAAPVDYCFHPDQTPIGPDEPERGHPILGLVAGRVIENGGDLVRVAVPDGETITTGVEQVASRRTPDHVPVGS